MHRLWAPWRMKYIKEEKEKDCIFCQKPKEKKDKENYILLRGKKCFVILNAFPYNNGHLMIAPYRHISLIEEMNREESAEMFELLKKMVMLLKKVMQPDGFNIGVNLGRAAGAGIEDHIHFHIVPRWVGDYNFMPLFSDTKVIPEALEETYRKLKENL
ncbi:HIT domain-containing protein [Candidatus Aerophobetes bacterium]|nr:HIT domain-containing protein [Candidatus Aerophobetes bacterium]